MGEEFEDRDLSGSTFWGVGLKNALFRDADFGGSRFFHVAMSNVEIDGVIDHLVVNGVDVTAFVNEHDRWHPLRAMLSPEDEDGVRSAWANLTREWTAFHQHAVSLEAALLVESVNGEWSYRDTLRHLLMVHDKWFAWPILGERDFSPIGLPNTGSRGFDWPGIDPAATPSLEEVLAERARSMRRFADYVEGFSLSGLPQESDVLENGRVPTLMCFHAVLEEEFEHLRYAMRDLGVLTGQP